MSASADNLLVGSTVATAVATLVALAVPFIMDRLAIRRRKSDEAHTLREICYSVDQIAIHYIRIRQMIAANALHECTKFRQIAVEAKAVADAIDRMLERQSLTDGPLIAGSAAVDLARAVSAAAMQAADGKPDYALAGLKHYDHLAQLAASRSDRVRTHHGLGRKREDPIPDFRLVP